MKIKLDTFKSAILKWIESDLANKGNVLQQAVITFAMLQNKDKVLNMINALSLLSDDNTFELEILHQNMDKTLNKIGGKLTIPFINYNFDSSDLNSIFTYARSMNNETN